MKKILYLGIATFPRKAPHYSSLSKYLVEHGACEIDHFAISPGEPEEVFAGIRNFTTMSAGSSRLVQLSFFLKVLKQAWRQPYDVFYVDGSSQTVFGLLIWKLLFWKKWKLLYHTQDYIFHQNRLFEFCEKHLARKADLVISNEINRATFMKWNLDLPRLPIVIRTSLPQNYSAPDGEEAGRVRADIIRRAGLTDTPETFVIQAGGGFAGLRMSEEVLKAFHRLPGNFILVLTGGGWQRSAAGKAFAEITDGFSESEKRRIVIMDRLDYDKLLVLYKASDLGLLLYRNNGIGNFYQAPGRLTEYLCASLPILASDYPGFELLKYQYGIMDTCNACDPDAIAAAITRFAARPQSERAAQKEKQFSVWKNELFYEKDAAKILPFIKS